ncbi:MAG: HEAT repeat domain-containing protein [Candidatus Heimdallarchaeota archaeon]
MNTNETNSPAKIEEELFRLIQNEISNMKFLVETFVHENSYESGKIIFNKVQNELFVQNLLIFPVLFSQVFPHIDDEFYIPTLIEILKHKKIDTRIRLQVTRLLGWKGSEAKEAIPLLVDYFKGESEVNLFTSIALAEMGYKKSNELIPTILIALKKGKLYTTRINAARILIRDKNNLKNILPNLIDALENDQDFRVRQKMARYFGEINDPSAKKVLTKAYKSDSHPVVRTVAHTSLDDLKKL